MNRPVLWIALALGSAAAGVSIVSASCAVPGFELSDVGGGTSQGAAGGAGGSGGAGACEGVRPPNPPEDATPGGTIEFVAALRTVDFGEDHDDVIGPEIGYDLDKECTCSEGGEPTCTPPGNAPVDCDGPGGRDNGVARLFKQLNLFEMQSFNSQFHTSQAELGKWSLLIRVLGYNGEANDDEIELVLYPSPGRNDNPCLPEQPAWDGTDAWPVDAVSLVDLGGAGGMGGVGGGGGSGGSGASCQSAPGFDIDQPLYQASVAYVTDSVLVAQLPASGLVIASNDTNTAIKLVSGFLTARIEQLPEGYALQEGVLAGRWKLSDIFSVIGTIQSMGVPICTNHPLYQPFKGVLCNFPDITADAAPTPAAPCDSLAFGMGFSAFPAALGIIVEGGAASQNPCPMSVDPAMDSCTMR